LILKVYQHSVTDNYENGQFMRYTVFNKHFLFRMPAIITQSITSI